MIYPSPDKVPWDAKRWPNFRPGEKNFACPCCGEFYYAPRTFDRLQFARNMYGAPIVFNSGHRCRVRNAMVSKSEISRHLGIAFDIPVRQPEAAFRLVTSLRVAGFTAFGVYSGWIHADDRPEKAPGRIYLWTAPGAGKWADVVTWLRAQQ